MNTPHAARSWTWRLLIGAVACLAAVAAGIYAVERARLAAVAGDVTYGEATAPVDSWRKVEAPGLTTPRAVGARDSGLADDEEVIGVVAGGRARAYRVKALDRPEWHIVNDLVGGAAVTVAYCNLTGCTQAYAGPEGGGPLDVGQGGVRNGEMIVRAGGAAFVHRTGAPVEPGPGAKPFPYAGHPWVRTTWKAWREAHPDTDVFVGP